MAFQVRVTCDKEGCGNFTWGEMILEDQTTVRDCGCCSDTLHTIQSVNLPEGWSENYCPDHDPYKRRAAGG